MHYWKIVSFLILAIPLNGQGVNDKIYQIISNQDALEDQIISLDSLRNDYILNGKSDSIAFVSYFLANWYFRIQDLHNSEIEAKNALEGFEKLKYKDYRNTNAFLFLLKCFIAGNRYDKVLDAKSLVFTFENHSSNQKNSLYQCLIEIGKSYLAVGDYQAGVIFLNSFTMDNSWSEVNPAISATFINILSSLYDELKNHKKANELREISTSILRSNSLEYQLYNHNIDYQYYLLRNERFQEVIGITTSNIADSSLYETENLYELLYKNLNNQFVALHKSKNYKEAQNSLAAISLISDSIYSYYPHLIIEQLQNRAVNLSMLDCDESLKSWQTLFDSIAYNPQIDTYRTLINKFSTSYSSTLLFDYLLSRQCWEDDILATKLCYDLDSIINYKLEKIFLDGSRINFKVDFAPYYKVMLDIAVETKNISLFWLFSERSKSTLLLNELQQNFTNKEYRNTEIANKLQSKIKESQTNIIRLEYDQKNETEQATVDSLTKVLAEYHFQQLQWIEELKKLEINNPLNIIAYDNVEVHDNQSILSYAYGQDSIYAIHISPTIKEYRPVAAIRDIKDQVDSVNKYLANKNEPSLQSTSLYSSLIAPFKERLEKKLLIIPDRQLSTIPWEVLTNATGELLIESHDITYAISYTHYRGLQNSSSDGQFNIIAPVYDTTGIEDLYASRTRGDVEFKYLPYAQEELTNLVNNYNAQLLQSSISKDAFESSLSNSKIFHFTGHGYQDPEDYRFSFLALNDDVDELESVLTVAEIESYKTNAELVVLNACNTGVGEMIEGEGVFSLARSFLKAGAKSVVNSLWSIDDQSSSIITISFYKYLKQGHTKSYALAQAKRDYLNSDIPEYKKHPYYWAGLILIGNDAPVQFESRSNKYKIMGCVFGGALLIFSFWGIRRSGLIWN